MTLTNDLEAFIRKTGGRRLKALMDISGELKGWVAREHVEMYVRVRRMEVVGIVPMSS